MAVEKKRHGCVTVFLIIMLISNSFTALVYFFGWQTLQKVFPGIHFSLFLLLGFLCIVNLVCTIALFKWKKWGFWGFLITSLISGGINLYLGLGLKNVILGLAGILLLYIILQIGGDKKAWDQLE